MRGTNEEWTSEPGVTGLEAVLVRELALKDLEGVVRIDARRSGRSRHEYYLRKLQEAVNESGVRISLAAEIDGALVGFMLGRLYYGEFGVPEPTAIIDSIGVDPDYRGQHVGAALLSQLETNLRGFGIETVRTAVDWDRLELLGFLGSHGFQPAPVLTLQKKLG